MLTFDNAAAIAAAPDNASLDPALRQLLADRVHDWTVTDLLDLTLVLVLQSGDTEANILERAGFSPLVNPLDCSRFGSPGFRSAVDFTQDHGRWFELLWIVGTGWAACVFVENSENMDPELLAFCKAYAEPAGAVS